MSPSAKPNFAASSGCRSNRGAAATSAMALDHCVSVPLWGEPGAGPSNQLASPSGGRRLGQRAKGKFSRRLGGIRRGSRGALASLHQRRGGGQGADLTLIASSQIPPAIRPGRRSRVWPPVPTECAIPARASPCAGTTCAPTPTPAFRP
jgi:hypothetical protein